MEGSAKPSAPVEFFQLFQGKIGDPSPVIGYPGQGSVMVYYRNIVPGQLDIEFQAGDTVGQGGVKSRLRVLRRLPVGAPVGHDHGLGRTYCCQKRLCLYKLRYVSLSIRSSAAFKMPSNIWL